MLSSDNEMGIWTPTEERRGEIVEAALKLLARTSVEALTTRELAKALGLSQPALFRHFRTREELLLAVIGRARDDLEGIATQTLGSPANGPAQLRALGEALLAHVEREPGLPRLLFGAAGPAEGTVRNALRPLVSMQKALAAELVRQGQREGLLAADAAPDAAATLFVGMLQGLVLDWELAGRPAGLSERFPACFALWSRALGADVPAEHPTRAPAPVPAPARKRAPSAPRAETTSAALTLLDVRPILVRGVDPLGAILEALAAVPVGGVLAVVAPFRPAPLLALLGRRGHAVSVEPIAKNRFLVLVIAGGAPAIEDLRDLEPPEPLQRILAATGALAPGAVHIARTPRVPRLLMDRLRERRVRWQTLELPDGSALVRVEAGA